MTCQISSCKHSFCGKCGLEPHKGQVGMDMGCKEYAQFKQIDNDVDMIDFALKSNRKNNKNKKVHLSIVYVQNY